MSRKDYIATAEIIRELHVSPEQRAEIVSRFVTLFSDDNPRFSPTKFREACEPESADYPSDNPAARLDLLASLADVCESALEREVLAQLRDRIRNGSPDPARPSSDFQAMQDLGYKIGVSSGSWIVDGNTSEATARQLLAWIEEGAPEWFEMIPYPLSGEYSGDPLPNDVPAEVGANVDDPDADDLLAWFESGYSHGFEAEVVRSARALLGLFPADLWR